MYWNESKQDETYQVPDDIVDFAYKINCQTLPLEHAQALSDAIHKALPWMSDEDQAGIHLIHGAESGNGWMRPEDPQNEVLCLSRRTRMTLRLPKERLEQAESLTGQVLDIDGYQLEVGEPVVKPLSTQSTIFSRYVIAADNENEEQFLQRIFDELKSLGLNVPKLMCGKTHTLKSHEGDVFTRSIMLAELKPHESVLMQQKGLGEGRQFGCGLFIPHKGIAPVKSNDDE
jgi:CRISPR-associated protein Cas6